MHPFALKHTLDGGGWPYAAHETFVLLQRYCVHTVALKQTLDGGG